MRRLAWVFVSALAVTVCSKAPQDEVANSPVDEAGPVENTPQTDHDDALLAEPKGPIDPKSAEAAGQVVQSFGALIEQKRWAEAEALWLNSEIAKQFTSPLKQYPEVHLEIGAPGDPEGAAGSVYVTMPAVFYDKQAGGTDFRRHADIILRRVNDVPGSTEAQRRWHIERIDWKD